MFSSISKLKSKYPILKTIGNRYFLVSLSFIIWLLFFDNYSYLEHRFLNKEIDELENYRVYYINEIKKDSIQIEKFNKLDEVEKYARENYFMKKDSEDIYIIEIEKPQ